MSLLEALVVVAIVALSGTLVYPRMEQAAQTAVLRHTATVLVQDLRRTRAEAVRGGDGVLSPAAGGRGYLLPGGARRQLPEGMFLHGSDSIRFFADGSASGGGLTLTAIAGRLGIAVDPATGNTSLVRP